MKKILIAVCLVMLISSIALAYTDQYGRVTDSQGRLINAKQFQPSLQGKTQTMPVDRTNGNVEKVINMHNGIVQSVRFTPDRYVSGRVFHLTQTKVVNPNYIACFEAKTNIPRYVSKYFTYQIAVDKDIVDNGKTVVVKDLDNRGRNMRIEQSGETEESYLYDLTTTQDKFFCVAAY